MCRLSYQELRLADFCPVLPTNVTAEYKKAEQAFRDAREPADRLKCLKEMLRTIPKHKGTEHLQADIKTRIKLLTDELAGPRKGGARTGPIHTIRAEGAAQVALLGPPNAGKSLLHSRLTGSRADSGPYPFTTKLPQPGMAPYEDISFQLIDLPPISSDYIEPWIVNALQPADAALLVIDIANPECIDHIGQVIEQLRNRRIHLLGEAFDGNAESTRATNGENEDIEDPFRIELPTLLVANKIDLAEDDRDLDALDELVEFTFPSLAVSAESEQNLASIARLLFEKLDIVRVYTKVPGKIADTDKPFTIRGGGTVFDIAVQVHKDFADTFRFARIWGAGVYDGQQAGPDHVLNDKDIIEIHTR